MKTTTLHGSSQIDSQLNMTTTSSNPLRKRVASLVRVSTLEQAQEGRGGLAGQKAAIERVVRSEDLTVIRHFEIVDTSGADVFFTPEMQEICELVRQGQIGGIVASELDRLVRPTEFSELGKLSVFQEHRCFFYYEGGRHDLSDVQGYMMALIRLATAASEKGVIRERTMRGKEALRRAGRWASSNNLLPRGIRYDRKSGVFSVDQVAIWPITEAYRIMDEEGHAHIDQVAKKVGLKRTGLRNSLQNPIYKGLLSFRTKRAGKRYERPDGRQAQRRVVPRSPEERHEQIVLDPAPVAPERWQRVQDLLNDSHRRWTSMRTNVSGVVFLLKGIGVCGHCGQRLVGVAHKAKGNSKAKNYYYCWSNHQRTRKPADLPRCPAKPIRRDDLEQTLIRFTAERLTDANFLELLVGQAMESRRNRQKDRVQTEGVAREIKKLENRRQRLLSLHLDEAINREEFIQERAKLDRDLQTLRSRQAAVPQLSVPDICKFVLGIVRGAFAFTRLQDEVERKKIIDRLFSEVTFTDVSITSFRLCPQLQDASQVGIRPQGPSTLEEGANSGGNNVSRSKTPA